MPENNKTEKSITWPFWIQVPVAAMQPLIWIWCFSTAYEEIDWLYRFFHEVIGPISSIQMLLCLPVGIIGLIMLPKMKKLRRATIILAVLNLLKAVFLLGYFVFLFVLIG